jgi:glycerol-3-phosphate O-acyltransferase
MAPRLGLLLSFFCRRFVDPIPYPERWAERIRELSRDGTIAYVHRARNPAEHLALIRAVRNLKLPRARFVAGMRVWALQPWWRLLGRFRGVRGAPRGGAARDEWLLSRCVEAGDAAEIFLKKPLTLVTQKSAHPARYIEALVRLARDSDSPIYLFPHFLSTRTRAGNLEPSTADAVFGSIGEPGFVRSLWRLVWSRKLARWEVSEPIELVSFVKERASSSDETLAKKVRWALLHHLARLERVAHGPPLKSAARVREDTLKDPNLRAFLDEQAAETGQPRDKLANQARRYVDEIASRFDMDVARVLDMLLRFVWRRIYDGLEVLDEDIERVREATRQGSVVLVPSHKSHVDYLVMSQALLGHNLMPPRVAAGANLSFFPLGPLFRRGGAFFLRRSFKGLELYARVFRAYMGRLLKDGFTVEFFIEGGRSRTGKTLPPKLGLLSMVVQAWLDGRRGDAELRDTIFLPASISYDKIIETDAYKRELEGGEKEKESAGALLKTASVLRSKYGRVFVTFDEPISLADFSARHAELEGKPPEESRTLVPALGHRIVWGIQRASVVTARSLVAAAILGYRRRGVREEALIVAAKELLAHIARVDPGARLAGALAEYPEVRAQAALEALVAEGALHVEDIDGERFYRPKEGAALALELSKNTVIHHFVDDAIVMASLTSLGGEAPLEQLEARAKLLSRVFKQEFTYQTERSFRAVFDSTCRRLESLEVLTLDGEGVGPAQEDIGKRRGAFLVGLILNFIEAYRVVAQDAVEACAEPQAKKALVSRLLTRLRAGYLDGRLRSPEAINKVTVETALAWLIEQGFLEVDDGDLKATEVGGLDRVIAALKEAAKG